MGKFESLFGYGAEVRVIRSDERGEVVGVSFNKRLAEPQVLVEYKAADGRSVSSWFYESELNEVDR